MDSKTAFDSQTLSVATPYDAAEPPFQRTRCKKGVRMFKFLGLSALLIWAGHKYLPASRFLALRSELEWPVPSDVDYHCAEWSDNEDSAAEDDEYPHSAGATFELPLSSEALFLLTKSAVRTHGVFSAGAVTFVQSDEVSESVKVDITVGFWRRRHLEASAACLLQRQGGDETGVGIFTRWEDHEHRHRHRKHNHNGPRLRFTITVTLPATADGASLEIKKLWTDLDIYSQKFVDLTNVHFGNLSTSSALALISADYISANDAYIQTTLAPISIESLVASRARVTSSLGSIHGTYNATDSLVITTSNSPIDVTVNLFNSENVEGPSRLQVRSANAHVASNISLFSSKDVGAAAFDLEVRTANAPLAVSVLEAPIDSTTVLRARTSLSSAYVGLPTTFEGTLSGTTSLSKTTVRVAENAEDPKGEGRSRFVRMKQDRNTQVSGEVGWSEEGAKRGMAEVRTSLAPVTIDL